MIKRLQDWVTIQAEQRPDAVAVAFNPPLPSPSSQAMKRATALPGRARGVGASEDRIGEASSRPHGFTLNGFTVNGPPQMNKMAYAELEAGSNRLARLLKDGGCKKGDRVCLLMPKSPMAILCILGIYKADCVFVPLDPSSPAARLAKIVESCGNRWILAAGPVTPL
ncbi:MAG: AMP-binding protein, partial [Nitrospirae bacterium]|nr:AMP-binding protein [Nitrospirota bacterium]